MFSSRCFAVAVVIALASVAGITSSGLAQATVTSQPVLGGTIANSPYNQYSSGNSGYPGYPYYTYPDPLQGAAAVINAQGQLMVNQQQAFIDREKARSMRIQNRRNELEQWLWEREHMPTAEDERERIANEALRRSRFNADSTEIFSAKALNDLLDDLRRTRPSGEGAPSVSDDTLAKINVTSGRGNIGLMKNGRLTFPLLLKRPEFEKETAHLDHLAQRVYKEANEGAIKAQDIEDMSATVDQLRQKLIGMAKEAGDNAAWDPGMYTSARTFLNQLDDAISVLRQPDAANFLSDKYNLKGKGRDIAEVVSFMIGKGLRFAPLTSGGEAEYTALYDALRAYDDQAGSKSRESR
jgi:hypothetical protein